MSVGKVKVNSGFTLLELVVALTMVAILAAIAGPSFSEYMRSNGVFSHRQDINSAMIVARTEALNRNKTVSICASATSNSCGGSWSNGWIVFQDDGAGGGTARDGIYNGSEEIITAYRYRGANSLSVIDMADSSVINFLSFNEQGRSALSGLPSNRQVLITVCDRDNDINLARGLLLIGTGRLIRTRDTNNDGIHEGRFSDGDGNVTVNSNLSCS